MIKVTIGKHPKEKKPFPKLMIRKDSFDYTIIFALSGNDKHIAGVVLDTNYHGSVVGRFSDTYKAAVFVDYNEPVTLQNV